MSAATTPDSFGTLLTRTHQFCLRFWKPLLIGAVIFGLLSGASMMIFQQKTAMHIGDSMMEVYGVDPTEMEQLGQRMQAGDQQALSEMIEKMGMAAGEFDQLSDTAQEDYAQMHAWKSFGSFLPAFGVMMIVTMLLSVLSLNYYLVQVVEQHEDWQKAFGRLFALILPLVGLSIWVFLRSFVWVPIPILNIILLIILGPRFALAGVIFLKEKTGVLQSASLSWERTRGYWGKIVGNGILFGLLMMIAMFILNMVVSPLGGVSSWLGVAAHSVIQQLAVAIGTVFYVHLAMTVMAHPLTVKQS